MYIKESKTLFAVQSNRNTAISIIHKHLTVLKINSRPNSNERQPKINRVHYTVKINQMGGAAFKNIRSSEIVDNFLTFNIVRGDTTPRSCRPSLMLNPI